MKKVLVLVLAFAMVLSMAACGKKEEEKVYTVITNCTYPPFDTTDENGNPAGFDMDLMSAIAEDQGFKIEFVDMPFDSLIPAIEAGQGDIIAAGMWSEDPERIARVDFSDVYYTDGMALVVAAGNDTIANMDSLTADMKVASQIGTNYADEILALQDAGSIKEAVILDGFDTCMLQLTNGDVDAVVVGAEIAKSYVNSTEGKVKIVGDIMNSETYGLAVQKGNSELLEKINQGLKNIQENGTYDELIAKWIEG